MKRRGMIEIAALVALVLPLTVGITSRWLDAAIVALFVAGCGLVAHYLTRQLADPPR